MSSSHSDTDTHLDSSTTPSLSPSPSILSLETPNSTSSLSPHPPLRPSSHFDTRPNPSRPRSHTTDPLLTPTVRSFHHTPLSPPRSRSSSDTQHQIVGLSRNGGSSSGFLGNIGERPIISCTTSAPVLPNQNPASLLPKRGRPKKSHVALEFHNLQLRSLQSAVEHRFPSKPRKRSIKHTATAAAAPWNTGNGERPSEYQGDRSENSYHPHHILQHHPSMEDRMDLDPPHATPSPPNQVKPWLPQPLNLRDPFRSPLISRNSFADPMSVPQSPRSKFGFAEDEGRPEGGLKGWGEGQRSTGEPMEVDRDEGERKPSLPGIKSLFGIAGAAAAERVSTPGPFPPLSNLAGPLIAARNSSVSSDQFGSSSTASSGRLSRLSSFASFEKRDSVSTVNSGPLERSSLGEASGVTGWWAREKSSLGSAEEEKWERKGSFAGFAADHERRKSITVGVKSRRSSEHALSRMSDRGEGSAYAARNVSYPSSGAPPSFGPYSMGGALVPLAEVSGSTERSFVGMMTPVSPRRGSVALPQQGRDQADLPRRASDGDKLPPKTSPDIPRYHGAPSMLNHEIPTPISSIGGPSASTANDMERAARRASQASLIGMEGQGATEGWRSHPYAQARERAASTQRRNSKSPTENLAMGPYATPDAARGRIIRDASGYSTPTADPYDQQPFQLPPVLQQTKSEPIFEPQRRVSVTAHQMKSDPYEPQMSAGPSSRPDLHDLLPKASPSRIQAEESLMYSSPFSHSPIDIRHRTDPFSGSSPNPDRRGFVPPLYRTPAPVPSVLHSGLPDDGRRHEVHGNMGNPDQSGAQLNQGQMRQVPYQPIRIYPANGMPTAELPGAVTVNENGPQGPGEHGTVINTPTGPRYICNFCSKSFTRPSSLRIHTYSHTGERPYVCVWAHCGRSFSVQSNLKRHLKTHTAGEPDVIEGEIYDQDDAMGNADNSMQPPSSWWQASAPGQGNDDDKGHRIAAQSFARETTPRGREIRKGVQVPTEIRDADEEDDELAEDE